MIAKKEKASLLLKHDRGDEAAPLTREVLEDAETEYGRGHTEIADILMLLATIHLSNGAIESSIQSFEDCRRYVPKALHAFETSVCVLWNTNLMYALSLRILEENYGSHDLRTLHVEGRVTKVKLLLS